MHNSILPPNYHIHSNDPRHQRCLACSEDSVKDRDHILRCQIERRTTWHAQMVTSMENRCKKLQTDQVLSRIIIDGINLWFHTNETLMPKKYPPKYEFLIRQQNRNGWRQALSGRLRREWARLQSDHLCIRRQRLQNTHTSAPDQHYSKMSDRWNGHTWTATITQELGEMARDLGSAKC